MKQPPSLTVGFNVDRANPDLIAVAGATTLTPVLGRCSARISCRSATERKRGDSHVLSAADQQERPTAVNTWSYLHVL
jgi:hypothetical protein